MKCPTCGYIGFETTNRCRNCGYEFPQAAPPAAPDLAISDGDTGGPLRELDMRQEAPLARPAPSPRSSGERPDLSRVLQNLDRVIGGPEPPADLPLFGDAQADLPPMVTPSATPRRPLAVRRTTPDPARLKPKPRPRDESGTLALDLATPDRPSVDASPADTVTAASAAIESAPPVRRALAAVIDFAIIAGIDTVILSFTLRLCGLTLAELSVLPAVPLAAFFGLMNGGYFAAFTAAGGQTIGKMALGLRVVDTRDGPVGAGSAVLRALGCLVSVVSLGLGFLPALVGEGGRALEDRLADTHVIRVSAA
jgi:uncharacterized RDD family membrane protein YckC